MTNSIPLGSPLSYRLTRKFRPNTEGPGHVCNPVTQAQQNYVITVPLADGAFLGLFSSRSAGRSTRSVILTAQQLHYTSRVSTSFNCLLTFPTSSCYGITITTLKALMPTSGPVTSGSNHRIEIMTSSRKHGCP